jgi:hypothetical protein
VLLLVAFTANIGQSTTEPAQAATPTPTPAPEQTPAPSQPQELRLHNVAESRAYVYPRRVLRICGRSSCGDDGRRTHPLYGGIHYPMAIENGLVQGECVGRAVLERVETRVISDQ